MSRMAEVDRAEEEVYPVAEVGRVEEEVYPVAEGVVGDCDAKAVGGRSLGDRMTWLKSPQFKKVEEVEQI